MGYHFAWFDMVSHFDKEHSSSKHCVRARRWPRMERGPVAQSSAKVKTSCYIMLHEVIQFSLVICFRKWYKCSFWADKWNITNVKRFRVEFGWKNLLFVKYFTFCISDYQSKDMCLCPGQSHPTSPPWPQRQPCWRVSTPCRFDLVMVCVVISIWWWWS